MVGGAYRVEYGGGVVDSDRQPATKPEDEVAGLERRFGWSNMFVAPEQDPRSTEPTIGERATLTGYLRAYRQTLELKCRDLDTNQLTCRSVPPSNLSLLGLVRHLADVERNWFRNVLAGEVAAHHFGEDGDWDTAFEGATPDDACVEDAWRAWRDEVDFAEWYVDGAVDLEQTGTMRDGQPISLREVLVHMIEEYARHCGHADLIRERIDGRIGQ